MARSYDSRRYPAGPYLEPTVQPALRGPKRTGPIGELIPGDDIEVARILARLPRKPIREAAVFHIKLTKDGTVPAAVVVGDGLFILEISEDMDLMTLRALKLFVTTASSSGIVTVQLRNITTTFDMLSTKLTIDANEKSSKTAVAPYVLDLRYVTVHDGDQIAIDVDVAGTGAKGLGIVITFK
jgi:hypothetical protein